MSVALYRFHDGIIQRFSEGCWFYLNRHVAGRLLAGYERSARQADYFAAEAAQRAVALRAAIQAHDARAETTNIEAELADRRLKEFA